MYRKIMFRGLSLSSKSWVYGIPKILSGKLVIVEQVGSEGIVEIDPETLGQFTNAKFCTDHYAIDIYEGDIDDEGNEVIWYEKCLGWFIKMAISGEEVPLYDNAFKPVGHIHKKKMNFKNDIDIKFEFIGDVIKKHVGINTPNWLINNIYSAFEEIIDKTKPKQEAAACPSTL